MSGLVSWKRNSLLHVLMEIDMGESSFTFWIITAAARRGQILFTTRRNIKMLCDSSTWFVDGTFKTLLTIFVQIFTIIRLRKRAGAAEESVAMPLVYALLFGPLQAVRNAVNHYRVGACVPLKSMSDFELDIINAFVFPGVPVSGCGNKFFGIHCRKKWLSTNFTVGNKACRKNCLSGKRSVVKMYSEKCHSTSPMLCDVQWTKKLY